jgi:succinyl-CoA synthetase beta subunit
MNIHEHQAKEMLKKFGIPVLNGIVIFDTKEIEIKFKMLK